MGENGRQPGIDSTTTASVQPSAAQQSPSAPVHTYHTTKPSPTHAIRNPRPRPSTVDCVRPSYCTAGTPVFEHYSSVSCWIDTAMQESPPTPHPTRNHPQPPPQRAHRYAELTAAAGSMTREELGVALGPLVGPRGVAFLADGVIYRRDRKRGRAGGGRGCRDGEGRARGGLRSGCGRSGCGMQIKGRRRGRELAGWAWAEGEGVGSLGEEGAAARG